MLELLAPAGNLERLKTAFLFGADAVYAGGEEFSLRSAADNFTCAELCEGIEYAHKLSKKLYVAVNVMPRNHELEKIAEFAAFLEKEGADAVIVSDLGAFSLIRQAAPHLDIHISTQANNVNYASCEAWHKMGAKRIVLARELSLEEISQIRQRLSGECELEAFVHGAMCVSYSGRCLLSNYLVNRDSNHGDCAQPCRWNYFLMEEKRQGEYMPVVENDKGTFIFNSKDLCMIRHIALLDKSGVGSLKIEGRVKSDYYLSTVVKAYRQAIDDYEAGLPFDEELFSEVAKVSHREYSQGFYFGKPEQVYAYSSYVRNYDIVGIVRDYNADTNTVTIEQRNRFFVNDTLEFMPPRGRFTEHTVKKMTDGNGESIDVAPHSQMIVKFQVDFPVEKDTIVRKKL